MFFAAFAVYLSTAAPTVTFWDSGELIAASYQLGISHQPGYPLYSITGRLFSLLPFGNIAYRLNLLSAFFSASSIFAVYLLLREIITDKGTTAVFVSALLALNLAFVKVFWSQAVVAEVYALNSLILVALVLAYLKALNGGLSPVRYMLLSGLLFGLGLVNHESLILYLPALIITWLLVGPMPGRERVRAAIAGTAFIILGLSVYIYLPLRSSVNPIIDIGDPVNLSRFWWVIKWGEYIRAVRPLLSKASTFIAGLQLLNPWLLGGAGLAAFVSYRFLKRSWRTYLPLLAFTVVYGVCISLLVLGNPQEEKFGLAGKFFIPVVMMAVVFMGSEAGETMKKGGRYAGAALAVFLSATAIYLLARNYRPNDYSRNFIAYDYAANSLKSTGERGVLFTWGDNGVFPLWYVQQVERYRDDAVLLHTPLMTYDWYLADAKKWLGRDMDFMDSYYLGENVFRVVKAVSHERSVTYDYSTVRFMRLEPEKLKQLGLVYFEGSTPQGDPWPKYVFRGVDDPAVFKGGMEKNIIQIYKFMRQQPGPLPPQASEERDEGRVYPCERAEHETLDAFVVR